MDNKLDAGEFSEWLESFVQTMKGHGEGCVPCGDCVACCTSSKFILIRPADLAAVRQIPKRLLFPAPGLGKGHFLLGYDERGHCPMFKEGGCAIYAQRPETCRQYDCRALAVFPMDTEQTDTRIKEKIDAWRFGFAKPESVELFNAVKWADTFLMTHGDYFPTGFIPRSRSRIGLLAIRIHAEFMGLAQDVLSEKRDELISCIVARYEVGK